MTSNIETILTTGAAGFIGFHVSKKLLEQGKHVVGVDNLNDYYDVSLKKSRLNELKKFNNFKFYKQDISNGINVEEKIDKICHLAAQAGVRYSLQNPLAYEKSNSLGTLQIFEFARQSKIPTIIYASSSSVYGNNLEAPFNEKMNLGKPISLYAATKKANELYAHTYHHLYGINMTGLRFFTVYGPWGRPDMALFKFVKKILNNEPIDVYNGGEMKRDFTYIDDIVSGVTLSLEKEYPFEVFNLARGETVTLLDFIKTIESTIGKSAEKNMMPMQAGDVLLTSGDIGHATEKLGYKPKVSLRDGVEKFIDWYRGYYNKK